MRVAVLEGAWQLAPVMNRFVLMLALPEDGRLAAILVGCAQEHGSVGRRCGSNQKTASRHLQSGAPDRSSQGRSSKFSRHRDTSPPSDRSFFPYWFGIGELQPETHHFFVAGLAPTN